jgi:hypothetical protein
MSRPRFGEGGGLGLRSTVYGLRGSSGSPFHRRQEHHFGALVEGGGAVGQLAVDGCGHVQGRVEAENGEQIRQGGTGHQHVALGAVVAAGPPPTEGGGQDDGHGDRRSHGVRCVVKPAHDHGGVYYAAMGLGWPR